MCLKASAEVDRLAVVREHQESKTKNNQINWVMKGHSLTTWSKIKDIVWALHIICN